MLPFLKENCLNLSHISSEMSFSFFQIVKKGAKPKMLKKMEYKWPLGDLGGQNITSGPYVYF